MKSICDYCRFQFGIVSMLPKAFQENIPPPPKKFEPATPPKRKKPKENDDSDFESRLASPEVSGKRARLRTRTCKKEEQSLNPSLRKRSTDKKAITMGENAGLECGSDSYQEQGRQIENRESTTKLRSQKAASQAPQDNIQARKPPTGVSAQGIPTKSMKSGSPSSLKQTLITQTIPRMKTPQLPPSLARERPDPETTPEQETKQEFITSLIFSSLPSPVSTESVKTVLNLSESPLNVPKIISQMQPKHRHERKNKESANQSETDTILRWRLLHSSERNEYGPSESRITVEKESQDNIIAIERREVDQKRKSEAHLVDARLSKISKPAVRQTLTESKPPNWETQPTPIQRSQRHTAQTPVLNCPVPNIRLGYFSKCKKLKKPRSHTVYRSESEDSDPESSKKQKKERNSQKAIVMLSKREMPKEPTPIATQKIPTIWDMQGLEHGIASTRIDDEISDYEATLAQRISLKPTKLVKRVPLFSSEYKQKAIMSTASTNKLEQPQKFDSKPTTPPVPELSPIKPGPDLKKPKKTRRLSKTAAKQALEHLDSFLYSQFEQDSLESKTPSKPVQTILEQPGHFPLDLQAFISDAKSKITELLQAPITQLKIPQTKALPATDKPQFPPKPTYSQFPNKALYPSDPSPHPLYLRPTCDRVPTRPEPSSPHDNHYELEQADQTQVPHQPHPHPQAAAKPKPCRPTPKVGKKRQKSPLVSLPKTVSPPVSQNPTAEARNDLLPTCDPAAENCPPGGDTSQLLQNTLGRLKATTDVPVGREGRPICTSSDLAPTDLSQSQRSTIIPEVDVLESRQTAPQGPPEQQASIVDILKGFSDLGLLDPEQPQRLPPPEGQHSGTPSKPTVCSKKEDPTSPECRPAAKHTVDARKFLRPAAQPTLEKTPPKTPSVPLVRGGRTHTVVSLQPGDKKVPQPCEAGSPSAAVDSSLCPPPVSLAFHHYGHETYKDKDKETYKDKDKGKETYTDGKNKDNVRDTGKDKMDKEGGGVALQQTHPGMSLIKKKRPALL